MPKRAGTCRGAFTLVELLVVVGIIAVLVIIIVPALSGVRAMAYRADCSSNLKAIGNTCGMYAGDNESHLPTVWCKAEPFTTYWMRTQPVGTVNLGLLAEYKGTPRPRTFYCITQDQSGNPSIAYDGTDNRWDTTNLNLRSSYPARLIEVNLQPLAAATKGDWNTVQYGEDRVIYSDFLGVDGFELATVVKGTLNAPHRGKGYNRLFGEGGVRWTEPGPLTELITKTAPTPQQQVLYYKELDTLP